MTRFEPPYPTVPAALLAGVLSAILAATAGCGGAEAGPPQIALDRSTCDGCGMLISDPGFAAGYRAGGDTAVFDDIGCLLRALDGEPPAAAEVWFLDSDQHWFQAANAVFVRSTALETPMGGHIQAFADRSEAERAAARTGGVVIDSFEGLRSAASAESPQEGDRDDSSG